MLKLGKYKLICFDLDGTLIDGLDDYIYSHLWDYFKVDKKDIKNTAEQYKKGILTYKQWVASDVKRLQEAGATKEKIISTFKTVSPMRGALELLDLLKKKRLKIAVISGSINLVLEHTFPNYKDIFDHVYINQYQFDEEGLIRGFIHTPYDQEQKATGLKDIAEKEKIDLEESIYVGDNDNDLDAVKIAGMGIAFNCKSKDLEKAAHVVIKEKDLMKILDYL